jgi:cytochrome P450
VSTEDVLDLDALGPEFTSDPYRFYAGLTSDRSAGVRRARVAGLDAWLVTGFDTVRAALADRRLSLDSRYAKPSLRRHPLVVGEQALGLGEHMQRADPPDHARLRRLAALIFAPARQAALRPRIQRIADDLLAAFVPSGRAELIEDFALPLPAVLVTQLLGLPVADRAEVSTWIRQSMSGPADAPARLVAHTRIRDYLVDLVGRKYDEPAPADDEDLLAALIAADDDGPAPSRAELVSLAWLLLVAGNETTSSLIGNGTLALLRHPDQLATLRAHPDRIGPAIQELLRYDGPVKIVAPRYTTEEVVLAGTAIPAGEPVLIALVSTGRDPARYTAPDVLDLTRGVPAHLAFSHGVHFCPGVSLGPAVAEIAFRSLLDACPNLRLAVDPADIQWRGSAFMRIPLHLPVVFTP